MAEKSKSKHKKRPCMCSWSNCAFFSQQITQFAATNDVWNGDVFRFCTPKSLEKGKKLLVIRQAIIKHVPGFAEKASASDFYIARHHFPRALLDFNSTRNIKKMTTFLSKSQVEHIGKKENSTRLLEKCNSVNSLLKSSGCQVEVVLNDMYVQAPVVPMKEVDAFVSLHCSERASRQQNRSTLKKPPPSSTTATTQSKNLSNSNPQSIIDSNVTFEYHPNNDYSSPSHEIVTPSTHNLNDVPIPPIRKTPDLPSFSTAAAAFSPQASTDPGSPLLVQDVEFYQNKIKLKYNRYVHHSTDIRTTLNTDQNFKGALDILRKVKGNFDGIGMSDGRWLYPCSSTNPHDSCQNFCIRQYRKLKSNGLVACDSCIHIQKTASLRESRQKELREHELKLDSKRPNNSMSPGTFRKKAKLLKQENKNLKRRLYRLNQKLDQYKDAIKIEPNDPVRSVLSQTFSFLNNNSDNARAQIIQVLLEMASNGKMNSSVEEQHEFADHIIQEIQNTAKRMSGKDTQVRYSPKTIRIALALWLRDNKAYEELQKASLTIFPSIRHLKSLKHAMKTREGNDPKVYCRFKDERMVGKFCDGMIGHLLFDEIKLKCDIAFNCRSNEVVGFVSNGPTSVLDLKLELEKLISEEDILDDEHLNKELALYANQFRFRSAESKLVHNSEFFFNAGNLSGDETLRQLMLVITGYEMIGVKIFGYCCDAGGSNAGLMKILRKGSKLGDPFPAQEEVSFLNFVDPTRRIYMWTCSTHNHKAMRNSQHRSKDGGTRDFLRFEDDGSTTSIGWKPVEDAHKRDEQQVKMGTTLDTDLTLQAVYPDKWSIMNYSLAKAVYSDKTISAMLAFAGSQLGCLQEMYKKKKETNSTSKFEAYLSVLQDYSKLETTSVSIRETVRTLEYAVAVHGIFTDRLGNKEFKITLDNIDEEEKKMIGYLSYFEKWGKEQDKHKEKYKMEQKHKKESKDSAPWKKHFLADQTYANIRIGVAGFFQYARALLSLQEGVKYVPALHANQSSLEAFFSWLRSVGRDTTSKYAAGVSSRNAINTANSQNVLRGNKMYNRDDVGLEEEDPLIERNVAQNKARRENTFHSWLPCGDTKDDGNQDGEGVEIMLHSFNRKSFFGITVLGEIKQKRLSQQHFSTYFLTDHTIFREYAQLSIGTKSEVWFRTLCKMNQEDKRKFDACCRQIVVDLWDCLEKPSRASKQSVQSSYHFQVLSYLQGCTFDLAIEKMPEGMRERLPCCLISQLLSHLLIREWLPEAYLKIRARKVEQHKELTRNLAEEEIQAMEKKTARLKEVNRFFGWAIFSLNKRLRNELRNGCKKDDTKTIFDEETTHNEIDLLDEMRIFENEIMDNVAYLEKYYYPTDRLYNNGWLTLVSPKYADFGFEVCHTVAEALNTKNIKKRGNECVKMAKEIVQTTDQENQQWRSLRETFLELSKESPIPENGRLDILEGLLEKTMNARIGFTFRYFKSKTTGRGGQSETSLAFRPELQVKAKPGGMKQKANEISSL